MELHTDISLCMSCQEGLDTEVKKGQGSFTSHFPDPWHGIS